MKKILVLHNTKLTNKEYKAKMLKKYPIFTHYGDIKIDVIKLHKKLTVSQKRKKYDSLYYDEPTCTTSEIAQYIIQVGHPFLVAIDLDKSRKNKKNSTFITSKITALTEGK